MLLYPLYYVSQQLFEFQRIIRAKHVGMGSSTDKHVRNLLFYVFAGTRGGVTRLRIVMTLLECTRNAHQIAQELGLDYKAVTHHMQVLERNSLIHKIGNGYGALYSLSDLLEMNLPTLDEAIDKLSYNIQRKNRKKVYL